MLENPSTLHEANEGAPREPGRDRVEARLAAELGAFRAGTSKVRRARVRAALQQAREGRAARGGGPARLLAVAAAVLLILGAFTLGDRNAEPLPKETGRMAAIGASRAGAQPEASTEQPAPGRPPFRLLGSAPNLREALDQPLLDEARRLAEDGMRIAAALVQSLPGPLRQAIPAAYSP